MILPHTSSVLKKAQPHYRLKISELQATSFQISYVEVLEYWDTPPDYLKLQDKKLGGGQFGIVKQGLLTTKDCETEVVAVKTVKGIQQIVR